jgi:16S rRNA (guanine527-N7)-methyltransferase
MDSSSAELIARGAEALGVPLSPEAVESLEVYSALLRDRAVPLGMISRADAPRLLERHVIDSLRASPLLGELRARSAVDLGSGAGLQGIPLSVAHPEIGFVLAEPRSKRAAFLELVVERLRLDNVEVYHGRAETLGPGRFDVATARALAPPPETWAIARPLLRPGGSLVLFAGAKEQLPMDLPDAADVRAAAPVHPLEPAAGDSDSWRTSRATSIATPGHLVIITAK